MEHIFFWGEKSTFGLFSNFYPCTFAVGGATYNCSEQYFMKKKQELFDPHNQLLATNIIRETNPTNIKRFGRQVKNFNEQIWNQHRYKFMYDAVYAKFTQNLEFRTTLLATGDKILVEASPYDRIWGIGYTKSNALANKDKWGQNLLGMILMELRSKLKD